MTGPLRDHDRGTGDADHDAGTALAAGVDQLHLQGAIFLQGRYSEAWAYRSVPGRDAAAMLAPGSPRVVLFHVVATGRCWIEVEGVGERYWADAGDVIVLPYGDTHLMGGEAEATPVELQAVLPAPPWQRMPMIEHGGGGGPTELVCGYLSCDDPVFDPAMGVLPRVFVVRPSGPAATWVRASIDYAYQQITMVDGFHFRAPTRLPQLVLIEVLKLHLASAPVAERGFVQALRDPVVAAAMSLVHAAPARKWSVAELAASVNVSVSVLDERFRRALGMPPIRYLTGWRMHLAQDLLSSTDLGVATIARRVGYESEEAFSRAFRRKYDAPPSVWRARG